MKLQLFSVMVIMLLAGCATSPISSGSARDVPPERIFLIEKLAEEGNSRAIFIRDVGLTGSGVHQHLFIDGKKVASLDTGEKIEFILIPGEHIFGVIPTDLFGYHALNTIDQDLKPGKKYFYRLVTDGNSMRTFIQRTIPDMK